MATKASPMEYLRQVKAEMQKVTWPSKQETSTSTIAVFIMVILASVFLFLADQFMAFAVRLILGIGV
ncbi:MAG: preprotein translocase subunit SecE [Rhodospirillales bacterium]|nr:preprotein translocase subunit SecE [Rhodospirillales bacterium]MCB9996803.1 preprotein translocase subunit SecE [Rhodospirillales bacterium]